MSTIPIPIVYTNKSVHANDVPIIVRAILDFCRPSILTILKYCNSSTKNEKARTEIAILEFERFKKDFKKQ